MANRVFLAVAWLSPLLFGGFAAAGGGEEIPLRVPRAEAGDWVLFRENGVVCRHTVVEVEKTSSERFVHCRIEFFDDSGDVSKAGRIIVAGAQEEAIARVYAAAFAEAGVPGCAETLPIAGKPVRAVVFRDAETGETYWFSDAAGILNLIRYEPAGDGVADYETLDFGFAGNGTGDGGREGVEAP